MTPLHHAARSGHEHAIRALLAAGAAVDPRDSRGCTPLHDAADAGNVEVARALLAAGADRAAALPEAYGPHAGGATPLDVARQKKHHAVVAVLLDSGS